MKIQFLFKWYDLWIGFFYDKKKNWIYFLPLPMIGVIIKLPEKWSIFRVSNAVCDHNYKISNDGEVKYCTKCDHREWNAN